jgi:glycosyltransferase involved in cell wall biosynthesis
MSEPLVSILMNCYNGSDYLKEALDSIYAQTNQSWEIILIDNCSTDNSKEIIFSYNERIKYYNTNQFMTLGEGRNFGIKFCQAKYITFLDTDDIWDPHYLEETISSIEKDAELGMVYSNIKFIKSNGDIDKILFRTEMPSGNIFRDLIRGYFLPMPAILIRRELLDEGEVFKKKYEVIEDLEFFTRLSYSTQVFYIDKVLAYVRKHPKSLTANKFFKFPLETRDFIECLKTEIINFEVDYKRELDYLEITLNYQFAQAKWMNHENHEARQIIKKILLLRKKYIIVYFFMFFSHRYFVQVMKFFKVGNY